MIVWTIAKREWREQARQPSMLGILATLFLVLATLVIGILALCQAANADPSMRNAVEKSLRAFGFLDLDAAVQTTVRVYSLLLFTQFVGMAGVMAGHTILHDRQCGTLTFLLLAPVRRQDLLLGKVLGAVGPALALYVVISGPGAILASLFPITAPYSAFLPPSPSFMVAFLLGGPAWALFMCAICTLLSHISRDVRTAQQGVSFVLFFMAPTCGLLLSSLLDRGVLTQLIVAIVGLVGAATTLIIGTQLTERDLER